MLRCLPPSAGRALCCPVPHAPQVTTPDDMSVAERFLEEAAAAARTAGSPGALRGPLCSCVLVMRLLCSAWRGICGAGAVQRVPS